MIAGLRKFTLIAICIFVCITHSNGQQLAQYGLYDQNPLQLNPAYCGSLDFLSIIATNRNQWVGFKGAPVTSNINAHMPVLMGNLGIGGGVLQDKLGPISQSSFYCTFAGRVWLTKKARLALGINSGIDQVVFNFNNMVIPDVTSNVLEVNNQGFTKPSFGMGIYYQREKFYLGYANPKLIINKFESRQTNGLFYTTERHHYFMTGGIIDINSYLKLRPSTMLKTTSKTKMNIDFTTTLIYDNTLWLGIYYRTSKTMGTNVSIQISKQIRVGYAFEFGVSELRNYSNGTHEICIAYDFNKRLQGPKSIRYF